MSLFTAWGAAMARFRVPVLAGTLLAVIGAGVWGFGVFGKLVEGGYGDPGSESARAAEVAEQALGAQGGDVLIIYTPARGTVDDAVLAQRVENSLGHLPASAVTAKVTYWQQKAPRLLSQDKKSALATLTLAGDGDAAKMDAYREIKDDLAVEGAQVQVAGGVVLSDVTSELTTSDLAMAEAISLPIVLILLLFLFGSLVAASLPVLVGGCAVLGSLGILHAVTLGHDVNSFAVNVASLLGLGMAIDYGLFMVGRFREEQAQGRSPAEAVSRTVATAGRTVLFSATLLMIALGGLLLFPQGFLQSLAYGGLAAVGLAALLSLTLLPALLAVLGPRVDKLPVRLPRRRGGRPAGAGWARLAAVVLRRPVLVALPILAGLLVLASPVRGVHFGEADERVLPASSPGRQALETLRADFPALSSAGIQIVVRGNPGSFAQTVAKVPGVAAVTPSGAANGVTVLTATPRDTDPFSDGAREAVRDIRGLASPAGATVLVGGTTARNVDSLDATVDRLPLMVGLLAGATLILMFLAFGSLLLPVKAVLMSALSLAATFGVLVWIFQDGHGADLLNVTPAPPEVGIVVLMAAVVFGLSTDYEVFLLSRMVEARTRGATTAEAVTTGLARTGRVISAAAVLLIVVTGAFALSSVTTMRFVGVGMILALILDATVVRMLLVPAVLGLLGNAAWWAPGPLRRLQARAGLAEYSGEELFPTESVGRHAAPGSAGPRAGASRPRHASWNEDDGPRPAWTAERVRPLPAGLSPADLLDDDAPVEVGPPAPITIPGAPPLFPTPDPAPPRATSDPAGPASASAAFDSAAAPGPAASHSVASHSVASDLPASDLPASPPRASDTAVSVQAPLGVDDPDAPASPAASDQAEAGVDLSLAETVRITTGERPTISPDEVETLDIASLLGNDQPRTGNGFGASGPTTSGPATNGPTSNGHATNSAAAGDSGSSGTLRVAHDARPSSAAKPDGEMSEEDGTAPTEVLDLDPESAARVAAEQERSGHGR